MSLVRSVNVGLPRPAAWATIGRTSIDKQSVTGPVEVGALGLAGDQVSNTKFHGGPDQAVYAYAREDLDYWAAELGVDPAELPDGHFAENLTTSGIDLNEAEMGERWHVGGADGPVLEVASVRTPCNVFKAWMGRTGFDDRAWVKRFALAARPGPYFRVVVPGRIAAGDPIDVVHRPGHGVTVATTFRALHTHQELLPRLLEVDTLPERILAQVRDHLGRARS